MNACALGTSCRNRCLGRGADRPPEACDATWVLGGPGVVSRIPFNGSAQHGFVETSKRDDETGEHPGGGAARELQRG